MSGAKSAASAATMRAPVTTSGVETVGITNIPIASSIRMFRQQPLGDHCPAVDYCQSPTPRIIRFAPGSPYHPSLDDRAESPKNPVSPWNTQSELLTNMAQYSRTMQVHEWREERPWAAPARLMFPPPTVDGYWTPRKLATTQTTIRLPPMRVLPYCSAHDSDCSSRVTSVDSHWSQPVAATNACNYFWDSQSSPRIHPRQTSVGTLPLDNAAQQSPV